MSPRGLQRVPERWSQIEGLFQSPGEIIGLVKYADILFNVSLFSMNGNVNTL